MRLESPFVGAVAGLLGAGGAPPSLAAQQFLVDPVPASTASSGQMVAIDLDGDGDQDLLAQSFAARFLHVFERVGPARFVLRPNAPIAISSIGQDGVAAVGDLDNDGDQDFVAVDRTAVTIRNDAGTLTPLPASGQVPATFRAMHLLDIDGDGDRDVLVVAAGLMVLTNDGAGNLTLPTVSPLPGGLTGDALAIADLDGDGRQDLLTNGNGLRCWMARGTALIDETALRVPAAIGAPVAIGAADVDGDGDCDLFGPRTSATTSAYLLRNDGTGRFTDASPSLPTLPSSATTAVAADDDGDGALDLLLGTTLLRNLGAGTFAIGRQLATAPIRPVDLDGDRFADYLSPSGILRNLGGTTHALWTRVAGLIPADLDGDGDQDVVGSNWAWLAEGGTFRRIPSPVTTAGLSAVADLDGDGDLDAVERQANQVRLFANDGGGGFTNTLNRAVNPGLQPPLQVFDYDRDGDLDIVTAAGLLSNTLPELLRNDGNWTFTPVTGAIPAGTTGVIGIAPADVDADGYIDLVTSNGGTTRVLRNRGNGTWATAATLSVGSAMLLPAQFDRDAELELVLVRNPELFLFDRQGQSWVDVTSTRVPGPAGPATRATAADIDTDGDLDLIIAGGGGFLLLNDGNGTFTDVTRARGPCAAAGYAAGDVDGDGDPDLFDGVELWRNQTRQLTLTAPAAAGGALQLEYVAEPGFGTGVSTALVTWALRRAAAGTPMFGGQWLPDIPGSLLLTALVSVGGRPGTFALPIPAGPPFVGARLQLQGLVIGTRGELTLANHIATTIE